MSKKTGLNLRAKIKLLQRTVLSRYKKHGRHSLPWRKTRDPYAILVSEMMLQQTQVDRVVPYFKAWMKKFPTPEKLARASLQTVLREWSGLGYNRRAKYVHDAAKAIHKRGSFPRTYDELRELPGVGDYTAKAVRVFAFNEPEVLIETNVRSVFIHHFFPTKRNIHDEEIERYIAILANNQNPQTWYAALMDYGTYLKKTHSNPSRHSKHHTRQSKFKGSLREVRGAILKAYARGENITDLRGQYIEKFDQALQSLKKDGFLKDKAKLR